MAAHVSDIWMAVWFFLPAGAANAIPVVVAHIPGLKQWDAPLDGRRTFRGRRIFGNHKTWRGLVAGMAASTLVLWLQQQIVVHEGWVAAFSASVDYLALPTLIVGPLFGLGALGGDAIESFFKRQRGVAPGHGWFPFDQIDYIIGGALVTAPFVHLTARHYLWMLIIWLGVHIVVSYIGYKLHLKERPV